jgi:hypothetical protein
MSFLGACHIGLGQVSSIMMPGWEIKSRLTQFACEVARERDDQLVRDLPHRALVQVPK